MHFVFCIHYSSHIVVHDIFVCPLVSAAGVNYEKNRFLIQKFSSMVADAVVVAISVGILLCVEFVVNHGSGNESDYNYVPTQPAMVSESKVNLNLQKKTTAFMSFAHSEQYFA